MAWYGITAFASASLVVLYLCFFRRVGWHGTYVFGSAGFACLFGGELLIDSVIVDVVFCRRAMAEKRLVYLFMSSWS